MSEDPVTWQYAAAVCSVILPPVAVYITEGKINLNVFINIFLTLLLWFPGVIHALYLVQRVGEESLEPLPEDVPPS